MRIKSRKTLRLPAAVCPLNSTVYRIHASAAESRRKSWSTGGKHIKEEEAMIYIQIPEKVNTVIRTLAAAGHEAYAVGGCVRDAVLGREPADWDITTSALPMEVKALFGRTIDTGLQHGTVTVMLGHEGFEVTTYRVDGEYEDCRHPKEVRFTRSLTEDLKRRDFTINAMAISVNAGTYGEVVDKYDGLGDIKRRIIPYAPRPRHHLQRRPSAYDARHSFCNPTAIRNSSCDICRYQA